MKSRMRLLILVVAQIFAGCGGGSVGTGTGVELKTFEGRVFTTDLTPVPDANVKIVSTGESATTDSTGAFSIESRVSGGDVVIELTTAGVNSSFVVPNVSPKATSIRLQLTVDKKSNIVHFTNLQVDAAIVGQCGPAFENGSVIVQRGGLADGTRCSLRVHIIGDGNPLANVPFIMQRRRCGEAGDWVTIGSARTGDGDSAGIGTLSFHYYDDVPHCVYRVIAPYHNRGSAEVIYEIVTLRKEQYDANASG